MLRINYLSKEHIAQGTLAGLRQHPYSKGGVSPTPCRAVPCHAPPHCNQPKKHWCARLDYSWQTLSYTVEANAGKKTDERWFCFAIKHGDRAFCVRKVLPAHYRHVGPPAACKWSASRVPYFNSAYGILPILQAGKTEAEREGGGLA